jgi:hypothetical protein
MLAASACEAFLSRNWPSILLHHSPAIAVYCHDSLQASCVYATNSPQVRALWQDHCTESWTLTNHVQVTKRCKKKDTKCHIRNHKRYITTLAEQSKKERRALEVLPFSACCFSLPAWSTLEGVSRPLVIKRVDVVNLA